MRPHWVLLIICIIMLPVECAVLLVSFAVPIGATHLGTQFDGWVWWLLFFGTLTVSQYLSLRLVRPYNLILWLLHRKPRSRGAG